MFQGIVADSGLVMRLFAINGPVMGLFAGELFFVDGLVIGLLAGHSGLGRGLWNGFGWTDGLVMGLWHSWYVWFARKFAVWGCSNGL